MFFRAAYVKLLLSEESCISLYEIELIRGQFLFMFVSMDLNGAFEYMEIDCFNKKYREATVIVPADSISWQPLQL